MALQSLAYTNLLRGIALRRGKSVPLLRRADGLHEVCVGLGWDVSRLDGQHFDLDVSAFLLGENDHLPSLSYLVYYNNLRAPNGAVLHSGDNRTGMGIGDDEVITVNLDLIGPNISRILFVVTIHRGNKRLRNFGAVSIP